MSIGSQALHRESRGGPPLSGSYEARVTKDAVAGEPLLLTTTETADGGSLTLDAPNWVAKPTGDPAIDDRCLVVLDESGAGWVVAWAGQGE